MSNVPHELAEEFPEYVEKMHEMKLSNAHFVKLFNEYHDLNREIQPPVATWHFSGFAVG